MTNTTIKTSILAALANSTSQNPIDTATLARGHQIGRVKAELMRMYQERKVMCCKVVKRGQEHIVWWPVGNIENCNYNQTIKANKAAKVRARLAEVEDE